MPGLGGDARVGLGSNITATLTVNPDFGQVEVDPAVVNLSDQEIFLNERRPFFVEGSATFDFGYGGQRNFWGFNWPGPDLYYTRRIGAGGANILGAMKLTGRLGSRTQVGALAALTQQEIARTYNPANGLYDETEVEPTSVYGVMRTQRQFGSEQSTAAIQLSGMRRFFGDGSSLVLTVCPGMMLPLHNSRFGAPVCQGRQKRDISPRATLLSPIVASAGSAARDSPALCENEDARANRRS